MSASNGKLFRRSAKNPTNKTFFRKAAGKLSIHPYAQNRPASTISIVTIAVVRNATFGASKPNPLSIKSVKLSLIHI